MTNYNRSAKALELFQVLASPVRLQIIAMLKGNQVGAMGLSSIVDGLAAYRRLSRSHVCEQLKVLEKAGLIQKKQMGKYVWYRLNAEVLAESGEVIQELISMIGRKGQRESKQKG